MNIKLIENVVNILVSVLSLLIEKYNEDKEEKEKEAKADHTLAEAVRNSNIGMTDEEILDRI